MTKLYLGVGHGVEPNGVFDPGAHNDADGTNEYDINFAVTSYCHIALARCGIAHFTETSAGRGHDVDYRGAVDAINATLPAYDFAVELHYDSWNAPDDEFGIYVSSAGQRMADFITARMQSVGVPTKPSYRDTRGLYFIEGTTCPALIVECGATHHREPEVLQLAGEIIAAAICDYFGVPFTPRGIVMPLPSPAAPLLPAVTNAIGVALPSKLPGRWVALADGGVLALDGAPFYGSMGGHPLNAPIVSIVGHDDDGYWLVGEDNGLFAFGGAPAIAPWTPFFAEYAAHEHRIVGATRAGERVAMVSNKAEPYVP